MIYRRGRKTLSTRSDMRKVHGVGINDGKYKTLIDGVRCKTYLKWKSLLFRVYNDKALKHRSNYVGCSVCDDWLVYSNFKTWYENQVGFDLGFELDKDLLVKGNKCYSPELCLLVPSEVNKFMIRRANDFSNGLPLGVHLHTNSDKYKAQINRDGKRKCLGTFINPDDAFQAYKFAKEEQARDLASKYKDSIDPRVYEALLSYKV